MWLHGELTTATRGVGELGPCVKRILLAPLVETRNNQTQRGFQTKDGWEQVRMMLQRLQANVPQVTHPKTPGTQYSRSLVPSTIEGMVFGTRNLKHWVLGPSESDLPCDLT